MADDFEKAVLINFQGGNIDPALKVRTAVREEPLGSPPAAALACTGAWQQYPHASSSTARTSRAPQQQTFQFQAGVVVLP